MNTPPNPENSVAAITPPWDPIKVRDLVRHAQSSGQHPVFLELGIQEGSGLRTPSRS
ncbi:MAG: hypothetical protein OSA48_11085 [Akkermansiaceae bacterium]|nr:hypothetical protein [Akkermansiaceae bacterium]